MPDKKVEDTSNEVAAKEMPFLDHLEELRWHIIRSVISVAVFAVIAFIAKDFIFHTVILGPSRPDFWTYQALCQLGDFLHAPIFCVEEIPFSIQNRRMTGQFTMHITYALVIGIICAFPYTFWELWRFVRPALYVKEKSVIRGTTFFVSILFLSGILFGYFVVSPMSVNFLANYQLDPSIVNDFDITSYVHTLSMIVLACGILFQLPLAIYFLSKTGVVTPPLLVRYRKHAFLLILVISAILTPPDVISQLLIGLPLFLLYQVSIFISKIVVKKKYNKIEDFT